MSEDNTFVTPDVDVCNQLLDLLRLAEVPDYAQAECGFKILREMKRWTTNRKVEHFPHEYLIAIRRLPMEWDGGYMACIPQLGSGCFHGDGETPEEALNNLTSLYSDLRELWADDPDMKWAEPFTEDNISWTDCKKLEPWEVAERFRDLLNEVNRKEILDNQSDERNPEGTHE